MNRLPTISIVTPTYNQGHFIRDTLRSIQEQNYPGLEHIVVDAVSTDETPKILAEYAATTPNVKIICEPDKNQSDAINKGKRAATGEVVAWLNSDDVLCPGALLKIGEAFRDHPNASVIYGLGAKTDRDGNVMKWVPFREFSRRNLATSYRVIQPAMFYKRSVYNEVGGLDESLEYAMDWELLIRLAKGREVIAINEKIAMLRCYEQTKTSTGGWKRMEEIAAIGRKHNGPLDLNFLSFQIRNTLSRFGPPRWLARVVDGFFFKLAEFRPIMIVGWPADSDRPSGSTNS